MEGDREQAAAAWLTYRFVFVGFQSRKETGRQCVLLGLLPFLGSMSLLSLNRWFQVCWRERLLALVDTSSAITVSLIVPRQGWCRFCLRRCASSGEPVSLLISEIAGVARPEITTGLQATSKSRNQV